MAMSGTIPAFAQAFTLEHRAINRKRLPCGTVYLHGPPGPTAKWANAPDGCPAQSKKQSRMPTLIKCILFVSLK